MLNKTFDIALNIKFEGRQATDIIVSQGDTRSVVFNFRIYDGVNETNYDDVSWATLFIAKPDRNTSQLTASVKAGGGYSVMLSPQALAAPGRATGGLALYGHAGERITTLLFDFQIVRDLINLNDIESNTDFDALRRAVALLESAIRLYEEFPRLNVLGRFETKEALLAAVPDGSDLSGGFFVGSDEEARYFYWSKLTSSWESADPWRGRTGPEGPPGPPGMSNPRGRWNPLVDDYERGDTVVYESEYGDNSYFYISMTPGSQVPPREVNSPWQFYVAQGPQGEQGRQGEKGDQGEQGIQGEKGETEAITNHSDLNNLDYESSGHEGFASAEALGDMASELKDTIQEAISTIPASGLRIPKHIELESDLPDPESFTPENVGDFYIIQNMDVTAAGHTGKAWVNYQDGDPENPLTIYKTHDHYYSADGETIILSSVGQLKVNSDWLNSQLTTALAPIKTDLAQRMPLAPDIPGRVHAATGGVWHALEGTEERAVITVARPATLAEIRPGVFKILNWDDSDVVAWEHNGAQVHYYKQISQHELYATGNGFVLYKFTFDDVEHTVAVEDCGVLPIERGGTGMDDLSLVHHVPILQNGFAENTIAGWRLGYTKGLDGWVSFSGLVSKASAPFGGAVFTFPQGYRPRLNADTICAAQFAGLLQNLIVLRVSVTTNGILQIASAGPIFAAATSLQWAAIVGGFYAA